MKTYYVLIHWDKNSAVTGFLTPNAKDENHAISMIKKTLLCRKKLTTNEDNSSSFSINRINLFLKALKRPWRLNHRDKLLAERFNRKEFKQRKTVEITELQLPTLAGYWLEDICTGKNICNII